MTNDDRSRAGTATLAGLDTETLPPLTRTTVGSDPLVVGFTVLCHPDPRRIGEQAHLQPLALGRAVELSRTDPEFRQPGSSRSRPLADPYVSRRALRLEWVGDALVLGGAVDRHALVVDGVPTAEDLAISGDELERGVVIELAGRIALLVHLLGMPRALGPDLGMVGHSEGVEKVRSQVLRLAATLVPVLLRGESGTGKELVAKAIHARSERSDGPFVTVNMAAIPPSTAASGLFGHVKGAFTGAASSSTGYFGQAAGGTLFLDEIGDTPLEIQALLLRALESGEVQPVGAQTVRHADVRVIAATENDLEAAVAAGRFRPAFHHRLAGFEIVIPPLSDRKDDIARLLVHFLAEELEQLGDLHKLDPPADRATPPPLDVSLVSRLVRQGWPGNVRQLRNTARHLAIASQEFSAIRADADFEQLLSEGTSRDSDDSAEATVGRTTTSRGRPRRRSTAREVAEIPDEELVAALRACDFKPGPAAERLGIGRTTMYKLMDGCDAIRKAADLTDDELEASWQEHDGDVQSMASALEVSERALKLRLKRFKA